jgi:hypothetical protein
MNVDSLSPHLRDRDIISQESTHSPGQRHWPSDGDLSAVFDYQSERWEANDGPPPWIDLNTGRGIELASSAACVAYFIRSWKCSVKGDSLTIHQLESARESPFESLFESPCLTATWSFLKKTIHFTNLSVILHCIKHIGHKGPILSLGNSNDQRLDCLTCDSRLEVLTQTIYVRSGVEIFCHVPVILFDQRICTECRWCLNQALSDMQIQSSLYSSLQGRKTVVDDCLNSRSGEKFLPNSITYRSRAGGELLLFQRKFENIHREERPADE